MIPIGEAPEFLSVEDIIARYGQRGGALDQILAACRDEAQDHERQLLVARARHKVQMVKGNQFLSLGNTPSGNGGEMMDWVSIDGLADIDDGAQVGFAYPFNVLRKELSIFIAVMGQTAPRVKVVSNDPQDTELLEMAKDADAALRDLWRKIRADQRQGTLAYHQYTTGPVFGHTVFVRDRMKYGATMEPTIEIAMGPDGVPVPVPGEMKEYVNGDVELRLYTVFDVAMKFGAKELDETPFLDLQTMQSKWKLIQEYPALEEYRDSEPPDDDSSASDSDSREARDASNMPSGVGHQKRSSEWRFRQVWVDPELYEAVMEKEARETLKRQYPEGMRIDRVGSKTLHIEAERKADVISICKTGTGDGIFDNPVSQDSVPIQQALNDLLGLAIETVLRSISRTIVSSELLDRKAIQQNDAIPGEIIFALDQAKGDISKGIASLPMARVSDQLVPLVNLFLSLMENVSGMRMELAGGGEKVSTFREAKQRKDQAQMRLSPQHKAQVAFWEKVAENGVKLLAKFGAGQIKVSEKSKFGEHSRSVDMAQLSPDGWHTVGDSNLPMSFTDRSDHLYSLMKEYPEQVQEILGLFDPLNLETNLELLQLIDHESTFANQKKKTVADVQELLKAEPIPGPDGMPEPSLPIDEFDDHQFVSRFLSAWMISEPGREARIQNPKGFENVQAFWSRHSAAAAPPPAEPPVKGSVSLRGDLATMPPEVFNAVIQAAGVQAPPITETPGMAPPPQGMEGGEPMPEPGTEIGPMPPMPQEQLPSIQ